MVSELQDSQVKILLFSKLFIERGEEGRRGKGRPRGKVLVKVEKGLKEEGSF